MENTILLWAVHIYVTHQQNFEINQEMMNVPT